MILQCKDLIATTTIAKDYGMSAKKFNAMLRDMGVQFTSLFLKRGGKFVGEIALDILGESINRVDEEAFRKTYYI